MAEYDDTITQDDIDNLVNRASRAESDNQRLTQMVNSMGADKKDENFLHLQIYTEEMLEKLEHTYRGDYQGYDKNGDYVWKKQTNKDLVPFNEFGVTSIMEILTKYIDKNTILSDYSEDRIYEILGDLGDELVLFILCNYEKIGMDTYFKKTKFRSIIVTTTHVIESTYRRALNAKTLTELNQSKVVGQFGSPMQQVPQGRPKKENFFNRLFN